MRKSVWPDDSKPRKFIDFSKLDKPLGKCTKEEIEAATFEKVYTKEDRKKAKEHFYELLEQQM